VRDYQRERGTSEGASPEVPLMPLFRVPRFRDKPFRILAGSTRLELAASAVTGLHLT